MKRVKLYAATTVTELTDVVYKSHEKKQDKTDTVCSSFNSMLTEENLSAIFASSLQSPSSVCSEAVATNGRNNVEKDDLGISIGIESALAAITVNEEATNKLLASPLKMNQSAERSGKVRKLQDIFNIDYPDREVDSDPDEAEMEIMIQELHVSKMRSTVSYIN